MCKKVGKVTKSLRKAGFFACLKKEREKNAAILVAHREAIACVEKGQ